MPSRTQHEGERTDMPLKENNGNLLDTKCSRDSDVEYPCKRESDFQNVIKCKKQWTLLSKLLLVVCVLLLIGLIAVVILYVYSNQLQTRQASRMNSSEQSINSPSPTSSSNQRKERTCLTKKCVRTAARIIESIDFKHNPCDDFYKFACGGWLKSNSIPPHSIYEYDIMAEITTERNNLLNSALEELSTSADDSNSDPGPVLKKLSTFYQSCMSLTLANSRGMERFKSAVRDRLGGSFLVDKEWKEQSWNLLRMLKNSEELVARNRWGGKIVPFFETQVTVDTSTSNEHVLQIAPPELSLFPSDTYFMGFAGIYQGMMQEILEIMGANKTSSKQYSDELLQIESKLARLQINNTKEAKHMSVQMLIIETGNKFNWLKFLNKISKPVGHVIKLSDTVSIKSLGYLKGAIELMSTTSRPKLANYFTWTLVINSIDALPWRIQESYFRFISTISGSQFDKPRLEKCMDQSQRMMGMALAKLYMKEQIAIEAKEDVTNMVEQVKTAFIERIGMLHWMDQETKLRAKQKATKMIGNLAFPDFLVKDEGHLESLYKDVQLKKDEFLENIFSLVRSRRFENLRQISKIVNRTAWSFPPTDVNARYYKEINKMIIPAGILKPPYYTWNGPRSLNFGGIGSVMGHELTHGFDSEGRKFDGQGNIVNWWTNQSASNFLKKTDCFKKQYNNYHVNGEETLNENLADNGGINVAFQAYQNWKTIHKEEPNLPGINFTNNQLFFISNSQIWCTKYRTQPSQGAHSPGPIRVKGMISNSREFADAFHCSASSEMNPPKKCSVW